MEEPSRPITHTSRIHYYDTCIYSGTTNSQSKSYPCVSHVLSNFNQMKFLININTEIRRNNQS